jgi:cytochrome c-type biogenesis protein
MVVETTVLVSALAGLGSFLSPCILPILPGFISYLSGTAANEAKNSQTSETEIEIESSGTSRAVQPVTLKRSAKLNIFLNTVYFVLGFSLVFAVLGVLLNSVLVGLGNGFQHSLTSAGGIVIIGFGAYLIFLLNYEP